MNQSDGAVDGDDDVVAKELQPKKSKMIQLPPKTELMHSVTFSEYERFIYEQLKALMNQIFVGYQQTGSVGKHFTQCLKMLLQLRQSCNHLKLIKSLEHVRSPTAST